MCGVARRSVDVAMIRHHAIDPSGVAGLIPPDECRHAFIDGDRSSAVRRGRR